VSSGGTKGRCRTQFTKNTKVEQQPKHGGGGVKEGSDWGVVTVPTPKGGKRFAKVSHQRVASGNPNTKPGGTSWAGRDPLQRKKRKKKKRGPWEDDGPGRPRWEDVKENLKENKRSPTLGIPLHRPLTNGRGCEKGYHALCGARKP